MHVETKTFYKAYWQNIAGAIYMRYLLRIIYNPKKTLGNNPIHEHTYIHAIHNNNQTHVFFKGTEKE